VKVVMTLLVRDEIDIIDAQLRYHLDAGVDFVVVTDHGSTDGTRDLLDSYSQRGLVRVLDPPAGKLQQSTWVSRMAKIAATDHGADWVLNTDADEFWWPRRGRLKDVLAATPAAFGAVRCIMRHFVPRPASELPFYEQMIIRHPGVIARDDPYHFQVKVAHRATPDVFVANGNHDAYGTGLSLLREWLPIEVLHFPMRSEEQVGRKYRRGREFNAAHVAAMESRLQEVSASEVYAGCVFGDEQLARMLAGGEAAVDVRLRTAMRMLYPDAPRSIDTLEPEADDDSDRAVLADVALFMETDARGRLAIRTGELERRFLRVAAT